MYYSSLHVTCMFWKRIRYAVRTPCRARQTLLRTFCASWKTINKRKIENKQQENWKISCKRYHIEKVIANSFLTYKHPVQCRLRRKHTRKLFLFQHTFFFNFSSIKPDFKNHIAWVVVARSENSSVSDKQEHTISEATQTYSNSTLHILKQTAFSLGVFQVPSER